MHDNRSDEYYAQKQTALRKLKRTRRDLAPNSQLSATESEEETDHDPIKERLAGIESVESPSRVAVARAQRRAQLQAGHHVDDDEPAVAGKAELLARIERRRARRRGSRKAQLEIEERMRGRRSNQHVPIVVPTSPPGSVPGTPDETLPRRGDGRRRRRRAGWCGSSRSSAFAVCLPLSPIRIYRAVTYMLQGRGAFATTG